MSNYWDLWCLDCDERHGFDNLNRENKKLAALSRHAQAIATLLPLHNEPDVDLEVHARYSDARIDIPWFAKHAGHRLAPKDEYGRQQDECGEYFSDCACGHRGKTCARPYKHDGSHSTDRDDA